MLEDASPRTDCFAGVLARLPAGLDLDELARRHRALLRRRRVGGGETLLRLALARGPGGLSLRQAAAWAGLSGVADLSNPALKARLDGAVEFLDAIVAELLARRAASESLLWPGRSLRIADGTCLRQPGGQGADWRLHAVLDLGRGGFSHLELTEGRGAEALDRGAPVVGEIRIADRGFGRAPAIERFHRAGGGAADFIVRIRPGGLTLITHTGGRFDLWQHLAVLPDGPGPHEVCVQARVKGRPDLPLRLVILRKPPAATAATEKKVRRAAGRWQQVLRPDTLTAAGFVILATSLPADAYPAVQILAAYRLRWQIELAFKRLKSLLHIDQLPTLTERASRSWLAAHLILALLSDALSQDLLDAFP
jgi:hypothetical protein